MSLVSNFVGGIGINPNGGVSGITPQFDLDDTTFSDLLEKQLNVKPGEESANLFGSLGMPAGMQIDGIDFAEKAQDQLEALGDEIKTENTNMFDLNKDGDVTTSEAVTFFTSLLDNNAQGQNARPELFDFARKQASNFYNKYSRDVITSVNEFVDDIKDKIS